MAQVEGSRDSTSCQIAGVCYSCLNSGRLNKRGVKRINRLLFLQEYVGAPLKFCLRYIDGDTCAQRRLVAYVWNAAGLNTTITNPT